MIVFLDIDNTLIDLNGYIPESAVYACKMAQENGHQIFMCTGRSLCEIYPKLLQMNFDGIVGGAGTYVELRQQVLADRPMREEDVSEIRTYLDDHDIKYILQTNDAMYGEEQAFKGLFSLLDGSGEAKTGAAKVFRDVFRQIERMDTIKRVNKLMYLESPVSYEQVAADLKKYRVLTNSVGKDTDTSGEISELGITKATGMHLIQEKLRLDRMDILAVGDGSNDMEMIDYAGIGVAMGNASDQLKEAADYVTADIHEDGIYRCFQHFHLI